MSQNSSTPLSLPPTKTYINPRAKLPCPNSSPSFWHSEPSPFLLHHRTTPSLPSTTDIVIIGSGITGTSIARYLTSDPRFTSHNLSVTLLEAREICWGATGRNGGHCQPLLFDRSPDIAAFEVKNVHAVRSYIEEHDVPCEWRSVTGCRSFWTDELYEAAKGDIARLREVDAEMGKLVSVIEKGDVKALKEHRVSGKANGVTLTEGAGQLWPYKYVTFIVEKLVREGKINVQTNTPVTRVEVVGDGDGDKDGKYRVMLHTPRGTIMARHAILATNGYTSALLPSYTDLIVPVRCEMSALHPPANSTRLPNSYGMVGYENGNPHHDDYLIQRPFYNTLTIDDQEGRVSGGHLMYGGGRGQAMYNCIGESDDDTIDPGEAEYLRRTLLGALDMDGDVEGLKELKASHQWTGIKGYSRDNVPWVGKVPLSVEVGADATKTKFHQGLWLCGGYTGHGMPNATLCGKAVVEMLLAEEEGEDQSGKTHENLCEKLVKEGDLPRSYLITGERLRKAAGLPSVAEQEGEGEHGGREFALVGGGNRKEDEEANKKGGKSKCVAM